MSQLDDKIVQTKCGKGFIWLNNIMFIICSKTLKEFNIMYTNDQN